MQTYQKAIIFVLFFFFSSQIVFANTQLINLMPRYSMMTTVYADIPQARSLTTIDQHLFVTTQSGSIYYVYPPDPNRGDPYRVVHLLGGLGLSHGIAAHGQDLYFTDRSKVYVINNILQRIATRQVLKPQIFLDNLPDHGERYHAGKYMRIYGDSMFISIGRPGDISDDSHGQYGKIIHVDIKTKKITDYATGLRNSVGMDINPITKHLWFTDNGPDRLGEELPKEEVNKVQQPGQFFGFPYTHGGTLISTNPQTAAVEPALLLPAHVAPLGMVFYRGRMFPEFHNMLLIAEHGSWARKKPMGYRISLFRFGQNGEPDANTKYEIFMDGWMDEKTGKVWGRPVDITCDNIGSIYISDDKAGVVYKLYKKYFEE